jgi:hypothetical protein
MLPHMRDPKTPINTPAMHQIPPGEIKLISGAGQAAVRKAFPGRVSDADDPYEAPRKPTASETEFRSRWFVSYLDSADGNDYRRGDPIPYVEAFRQGLVDDQGPIEVKDVLEDPELADEIEAARHGDPRITDTPVEETSWQLLSDDCRKCLGTGLRVAKFKGVHKPDCACPGCKPCSDCEGSGKA